MRFNPEVYIVITAYSLTSTEGPAVSLTHNYIDLISGRVIISRRKLCKRWIGVKLTWIITKVRKHIMN